MFKTHVGPVEDDAAVAYLRPETAQGIFVNFQNVQTTTRKKPPFGIAQIGKSFRNEITPGNFIFRTREFEQMEMEYFVPPDDSPQWYEYWCQERFRWYTDLGIPEEKLRLRPHDADELSHYSIGTSDVEFLYPWGWGELEGIAQRTDFDLTQHSKFSGQDLSYYDQENDRRYLPYVIEPAAGADRATLAFLLAAYDEDDAPNEKGGTDKRTVLRFHPAAGADQGRGAAAVEERQARAGVRRGRRDAPSAPDDRRRHGGLDRPALPSPGRGRDAVVRHDRLRHPRRQGGHHPRPRHDDAGPCPDRHAARRAAGPIGAAMSDDIVLRRPGRRPRRRRATS